MRKSESIKSIVVDLIKVQKNLEAIPKKGANPHFKSSYATLDDVIAEVIPRLNAHEIFLTQTIDNNEVLTTLLHTSGEWIESAIPLINKKGDDQGQGSSITYAKRYGLLAILGIPTEDDDANEAVKTEYKKPLGVQKDAIPPKIIPNRAPGADVSRRDNEIAINVLKPQTNKWGDYTIKVGKNAGKTIKSLGIGQVKSSLEYWRQQPEAPKGKLKEDIFAMEAFSNETAENNKSKVNTPSVPPPTTDYEAPVWENDPNDPF